MNKLLLFITFFVMSSYCVAQCAADYDFGDGVEFGVSPNPAEGQEFATATVGIPYSEVIHMLVPTDAGDINETLAGYAIDSLELVNVTILIGTDQVLISEIGLEVECNNNGDSENPCLFLGGAQYCATIAGTPTLAGDFPLTINVLGHVYISGFGSQSIPYFFDQYVLHVNPDGPNSIERITDYPTLNVSQNLPNPFSSITSINFETNQTGMADFIVRNLLGEVVYEEKITAKRGSNTYKFDAEQLNSGIYMYSLDANGTKVTKRMVVNK